MKNTLLAAITLLCTSMGLHAQSSSLLIQTGDQVNGISSNPATIRFVGSVSMNDLGGIAFQGSATQSNITTNMVTRIVYSYTTNFVTFTNTSVTPVTNIVTRTNSTVIAQYTNVLASNVVISFTGTVTNVIYRTNYWNVNGTTNAYVSQTAQIQYAINSPGIFTNIIYQPLGFRLVTNTFTTNIPQISYRTNYTVTNRPVVTVSSNTITTNAGLNTLVSYSGIWASDSNGSVNLIVRSGQPSGISNYPITSLFNPVINNNGAVAFIGWSLFTNPVVTTNGTVTNVLSNVQSIHLVLPGYTNPIVVASVGSQAPGLSSNFTSFGTIVLPDVGGVIFTGWAGTNNGIWVQDPDFSVRLVACRGQSISVGSTNKVISSFSLMNRFHSQDAGIITYQASFTDGTSGAVRVNR